MGVPILMDSFIFFVFSHFFVLAVPATSMVFVLLNLPLGCTVWVRSACQVKLLGVPSVHWGFYGLPGGVQLRCRPAPQMFGGERRVNDKGIEYRMGPSGKEEGE